MAYNNLDVGTHIFLGDNGNQIEYEITGKNPDNKSYNIKSINGRKIRERITPETFENENIIVVSGGKKRSKKSRKSSKKSKRRSKKARHSRRRRSRK